MLITSSGPRAYSLFFFPGLVINLDGIEVSKVVEADDEAGYIIRYVTDETGKLVTEGVGRHAKIKRERLEGRVEFIGARRYSPDDARRDAEAKRARKRARNLRNANRAEVRSFSNDGAEA